MWGFYGGQKLGPSRNRVKRLEPGQKRVNLVKGACSDDRGGTTGPGAKVHEKSGNWRKLGPGQARVKGLEFSQE